ncbi:LutC/YkgG family protein [Alicyclobacillus herbarius]|uniref:LutC/YkgG family protein n=1 Tax=Alicyclobacillus herbarius TaxID=122960 RepID=UPI000406F26B|nr:lactate utilization protein [Alicyclobacillus herbarius]
MEEQAFLNRIRERLGRAHDAPVAPYTPGSPDFWQAQELPLDQRVARFVEQFAQQAGQAMVCETLADLHETLAGLLAELAPRQIGAWGGDTLQQFQLEEVLSSYPVVRWGEAPAEAFADTEVGITGCAAAIADTGTLVMAADPWRGRSVHLMPTVHIALVHANQVVTRLGEALPKSGDRVPSALHFVSGPSRSSDIENDLSIGVHGPAAVYALILKAPQSPRSGHPAAR